jgi:hydroxymethylglutaryl-CoA lyase
MAVEIWEVGPRDGLQGLPSFVPTERKIRLVEDLVAAGLRTIEVASFVSPKATPQMRDGREVVRGLRHPSGVTFAAFVPNARGLEAAMEVGIDVAGNATYATESFARANVNATVAETIARIREQVAATRGTRTRVRGYVSCAVECPFEGPVDPERVAALAEELAAIGCEEVFLGDTTGKGSPATIARLADAVLRRVPAERLGVHFHDTFGQALANVLVCVERGIRKVDASVAGLGGCPAAEGAAGNVATEDLVYALRGLGIAPAVELERVAAIGAELCRDLGIRCDSKAGRAIAAKAKEKQA